MAKVVLCQTPNGKKVYFEDKLSHTATHAKDSPQLLNLAREFLTGQAFEDEKVFVEHDTGRIIGRTDLGEVKDSDEIIYAKRVNRDNFTKFVKNREAPPTSFFTVLLFKDEAGDYELASLWIGRICPSFPDDANATPESRPFWDRHALVFGNQAIQKFTTTTICPW